MNLCTFKSMLSPGQHLMIFIPCRTFNERSGWNLHLLMVSNQILFWASVWDPYGAEKFVGREECCLPSSVMSWDFEPIFITAPSYQTTLVGDLFINAQHWSWAPTLKKWQLMSVGHLINWTNTVKWMIGLPLCRCAPMDTCLPQDSSTILLLAVEIYMLCHTLHLLL